MYCTPFYTRIVYTLCMYCTPFYTQIVYTFCMYYTPFYTQIVYTICLQCTPYYTQIVSNSLYYVYIIRHFTCTLYTLRPEPACVYNIRRITLNCIHIVPCSVITTVHPPPLNYFESFCFSFFEKIMYTIYIHLCTNVYI